MRVGFHFFQRISSLWRRSSCEPLSFSLTLLFVDIFFVFAFAALSHQDVFNLGYHNLQTSRRLEHDIEHQLDLLQAHDNGAYFIDKEPALVERVRECVQDFGECSLAELEHLQTSKFCCERCFFGAASTSTLFRLAHDNHALYYRFPRNDPIHARIV